MNPRELPYLEQALLVRLQGNFGLEVCHRIRHPPINDVRQCPVEWARQLAESFDMMTRKEDMRGRNVMDHIGRPPTECLGHCLEDCSRVGVLILERLRGARHGLPLSDAFEYGNLTDALRLERHCTGVWPAASSANEGCTTPSRLPPCNEHMSMLFYISSLAMPVKAEAEAIEHAHDFHFRKGELLETSVARSV